MEILSAHVVQAMAQAGMNATTVIQPEVTQCYDKDTSSLTVKVTYIHKEFKLSYY